MSKTKKLSISNLRNMPGVGGKTAGELAAAIVRKARGPQPKSVKREAVPVATAKSETAQPVAAAPKPKKVKGGPCECGCDGQTKGGRYLPGHDSIHRAKLAGPKVMPFCKCGCGGQTKGGIFLPGHDAKYHSAIKKAQEAANPKSDPKAKPAKGAVNAQSTAAA